LAQYYLPSNSITPYVGAGINVTQFSGFVNKNVTYDKNHLGGVVQAGFYTALHNDLTLNVELKKAGIKLKTTDEDGSTTSKYSPFIVGFGVGYVF